MSSSVNWVEVSLIAFYVIIALYALISLDRSKPNNVVVLLLFLLLVGVVTLRPSTMSDYQNYEDAFIYSTNRFEVGFNAVVYLARIINNSFLTVLFIFAVLSVFPKLYAIRNYAPFFFVSLAIYISNIFILHDMIQIRTAVASGLLLVGIRFLHDRSFWKYFIAIAVAGLFHYSAFVFILLWFLKPSTLNKTFYILLIIVSYLLALFNVDIASLLKLIPIDYVQQQLEMYDYGIAGNTSGRVNIFNAVQIVRIVICVIFILYSAKVQSRYPYSMILIKIYTLSVIMLPLFKGFPVLAFRISESLSVVEILLIPLLAYVTSGKRAGMAAALLFGLGLLLVNIYYVKLV